MIPADIDLLESAEGPIALEEAYLPSTSNRDIEETVEFLAKCTNLRILDLSNTVVTGRSFLSGFLSHTSVSVSGVMD